MSLKPPPPKPRAGMHRKPAYRGPRIDGLGSPAPPSLRQPSPSFTRASTPRRTGPKSLRCSNPHCPNPNIVESEQGLICDTCGAVAQEESGLVSEQGFGETESGRITALGAHVGEHQTHQRTYAPGGGMLGHAGREPTVNRDRSEAHAKTVMLSYQSLLGVRLTEVDAGMQIFRLAWANSFVQGRTIDSVAVVCLYLACRRKHEQIRNERRPMYSLMLIDFAEKLNIDVFALGKMYSDLVRKLYLTPDGSAVQADVSADLMAMGPEVLVSRFVDELEFDKVDRDKIKMDAIRIVQRMKRDWMSTGRRPSGVCGAAIILAARMNNYRRTTREVVLTAKVTEITINKRLEEFQDTASSQLSVSQFRNNELLDSLVAADPPSYQRGLNPKAKKKRGRPRKNPLPETAAEIEGNETTPEPRETENTVDGEPPAKRARLDEGVSSNEDGRRDPEGFRIPAIPQRQMPIDPALESANVAGTSSADGDATKTRGSGRPPGARNWQAPPVTTAEIAIENELEQEVLAAFRENPDLDPTGAHAADLQAQAANAEPIPTELAEDMPLPDLNPLGPTALGTGKDKTPGPAVDTNQGNLGNVSLSPTLKPNEFDDDDDVSSCLLSEEEARIKERVWVSMNADWLRHEHAKRIKQELKEADMRARGLDPAKEALKASIAKTKRKDGTKKPGRRGDVSYLNEREKAAGEGGAEGDDQELGRTDRERSAAESVRKMFKTRGVFSRRINYDVVESIYGIDSADSADSRSASRSQSVASEVPGQDAREGSVASSVAEPALGPGAMFRGNGGRSAGRERSQASFSAERRERRKKDQQLRESQDRERERSGSASQSRSPSAPAADGPSKEQRKSTVPSPEPEPASEALPGGQSKSEAQQQPTPPATQSQDTPQNSLSGPPPIRASATIPAVSSSARTQVQQSTPSSQDDAVQGKETPDSVSGTSAAGPNQEATPGGNADNEDGNNEDDDDHDEAENDDEEDDYVRDEDVDLDAAFGEDYEDDDY
ncbi:transcription factor TFIIIB subunit brf1 [Elasticomyces elasticus]|nr:transcription factor TFIIIB subunit brf1 [Elasticomyces elasticus]